MAASLGIQIGLFHRINEMTDQLSVTTNYRPEIDGLRAIAVVVVVFYHAGFNFFQGGFVGVDVFFVISGYLITRILMTEMDDGAINYLGFFERRARRILPALFIMLLLVTPPAYLLLPPSDLRSFANSLLGAAWFSSNFVFLGEAGYFDRGADAKPLLHTWSLAVEEQFYLFFPVFIAVLSRLGKILSGLVIGVITSFIVASIGLQVEADWPFYMLASRAWELGLGAIVAVSITSSWVQRLHAHEFAARATPLIGLSLIGVAVATFSERTPTPGALLLLPTLGTALILLAHATPGRVVSLLSHPMLVKLGLMSYGFYLWHQPLLVLCRFYAGADMGLPLTWTAVFAALLMAALSLRWVEQLFRDRSKVSKRFLFVSLFLSAILITGLGVAIKSVESPRQRAAAIAFGDAGHANYYRYMDRTFERCSEEELLYRIEIWEEVPRCHLSNAQTPVKVAFFGDSHAEQLFVGAAPKLDSRSIYLIRGGLPFLEEDRFRSPFYFMQQQDSLELVVFSAYWTEKIQLLGGDEFVSRLFETVKWMVGKGFKVVLMMDTPDFGFGPERCLYPQGDAVPQCNITNQQHRTSQYRYRAVFQKIAEHPRVELVDVSGSVCDDEECKMIIGDSLLYRDNDHLNLIGSNLAGQSLLDKSQFLQAYIKQPVTRGQNAK